MKAKGGNDVWLYYMGPSNSIMKNANHARAFDVLVSPMDIDGK